MVCSATRKNVVISIMLASAYALIATPGHAEEMTKVSDQGRRFSAEVKPLPFLVAVIPGSFGLGGEFEAKMTSHVSVFADAYYMRLRLTDNMVKDLQKDQDEPDSIPKDTTTDALSLGARYYSDAYDDSWYAGAKFGGGTTHVNWAYGDERLEDNSLFYTTQVEAGYRWLWDSGLLVRLGFGFGATNTPKRDIAMIDTTAADDNARRDVEDKAPTDKTALGASFDFGLGYNF